MWRKLVIFAVLAAAGSVMAAEPVFCRSGEVLKPWRENSRPSIQNFDEYTFPNPEGSYAYIMVPIRPDAGRAMSIFDYVLVIGSNSYPCIALRVGNGAFSASDATVRDFGGQDVTLCFRVDTRALAGRTDIFMRYQLSASGLVNTRLNLQ